MNNYRYLAVDESNHGQFPEIYVAAFSTNPEDVQIHKRLDLSKIRHKEEKIQNILITSNFKYIVIEKYYKRFFGICGTQIIVLSEFFKAFQRIDTIYLDGQLTKGVASGVKQVLGRKKPNLLGILFVVINRGCSKSFDNVNSNKCVDSAMPPILS